MIDPNTPLGTYDLKVIGLFAKAWDHTPGIQEQPIPWTNDTLQLVIVPEPATSVLVGLFGVMGWRARRRRG
jgi:hypothetical protein